MKATQSSKGLLVLALLTVSACSTIVEGTDQSVTVATDPSGAACTLERDGSNIGYVDPTPGTVSVSKSRHSISVLCDKDGYQDAAETLPSEFQAMTVGNVLFGGVIGVGVDAASGAMNKYPDSIRVRMIPELENQPEPEDENDSVPMS